MRKTIRTRYKQISYAYSITHNINSNHIKKAFPSFSKKEILYFLENDLSIKEYREKCISPYRIEPFSKKDLIIESVFGAGFIPDIKSWRIEEVSPDTFLHFLGSEDDFVGLVRFHEEKH